MSPKSFAWRAVAQWAFAEPHGIGDARIMGLLSMVIVIDDVSIVLINFQAPPLFS